ncbi:hypothetical protein Nmel_006463, partial [Mimus melanotis]
PRARGPAPQLHGVAARASGERRHFLPSAGAGRQRLRQRAGAGTGSGRQRPPGHRWSGSGSAGAVRTPLGPAWPHGRAGDSERCALPFTASCRIISGCHSSPPLAEKDAVLKALLGSISSFRYGSV